MNGGFPNGAKMLFRHCQTEQDKFNYQGAEIYGLYMDELTLRKTIYDFFISRLRAPVEMGIKPYVKCTSNPGGIGHGWVKGLFIDPMPKGGQITRKIMVESLNRVMDKTYAFIPATLADNPHLGIEYAANLETLPKAMRDAYIRGGCGILSRARSLLNGATIRITIRTGSEHMLLIRSIFPMIGPGIVLLTMDSAARSRCNGGL